MGIVINIALLSLAFLGTLAAFGGETWKKTDEPLLRRITTRGWLSIVFLCLTLILGVFKEVRNAGEKDSLVAQVNRLRELLYGQSALLAAKRLEEIGVQERMAHATEQQLAAVKSVFDKHSNLSLSVGGRAQRKNAPVPPKLEFSLQVDDFAFDVCSANFKLVVQRDFDEDDCRNLKLQPSIDAIPDTTFEQGPFGPSVVAFLQVLGETSVDHGEALNGEKSLVKVDGQRLSLDVVLKNVSGNCNSPALSAATVTQAKLLRRIEESAQQLWWLFRFGFPVDATTDAKHREWLAEQLLGSDSEFFLQLTNLNAVMHGQEDSEHASTLGRAVENVAFTYRAVRTSVSDSLSACRKRKEELATERANIESRFKADAPGYP